MLMMKKFLHSTLLLGAALLCGFGFSACNSDNEPEDTPVITKLEYSLIQAPQMFSEPLDKRELTETQIREMTAAQNKGAVVLRTLKEVENYFGSKLEENSPLRSIDYTKKSVVTATVFLAAPIVKTTLGWQMQTNKSGQIYIMSCMMQYNQGTEDAQRNIFYNVQPTIVVDAIPLGAYVVLYPDASLMTNPS